MAWVRDRGFPSSSTSIWATTPVVSGTGSGKIETLTPASPIYMLNGDIQRVIVTAVDDANTWVATINELQVIYVL